VRLQVGMQNDFSVAERLILSSSPGWWCTERGVCTTILRWQGNSGVAQRSNRRGLLCVRVVLAGGVARVAHKHSGGVVVRQ
jgi:hypothetical protein